MNLPIFHRSKSIGTSFVAQVCAITLINFRAHEGMDREAKQQLMVKSAITHDCKTRSMHCLE